MNRYIFPARDKINYDMNNILNHNLVKLIPIFPLESGVFPQISLKMSLITHKSLYLYKVYLFAHWYPIILRDCEEFSYDGNNIIVIILIQRIYYSRFNDYANSNIN